MMKHSSSPLPIRLIMSKAVLTNMPKKGSHSSVISVSRTRNTSGSMAKRFVSQRHDYRSIRSPSATPRHVPGRKRFSLHNLRASNRTGIVVIMERTRYSKADFAWAKWGASDFKRIAADIVKEKKASYAAIRAIPAADRTFENTIYMLEKSEDRVSDDLSRIGLLKEVSTDPKIREAAAKTLEALQKQLVEIEFDPRMYAAIKEYAQKKEKLTGPEKLLFEDLLKGYARMGFDLPKAKFAKLKANIKELGKLGLNFDKNLNEHKDHILVTETELDGLPESYRSSLARVGDAYKVTLAYPDVHPFMAGAHDESLRRILLEKFVRRGGQQNI